MAAKAHLRNERPLVVALSTNDAMGMNFKNIGALYNVKHIYFVPFGQDDPAKKPNSLISDVGQDPGYDRGGMRGQTVTAGAFALARICPRFSSGKF